MTIFHLKIQIIYDLLFNIHSFGSRPNDSSIAFRNIMLRRRMTIKINLKYRIIGLCAASKINSIKLTKNTFHAWRQSSAVARTLCLLSCRIRCLSRNVLVWLYSRWYPLEIANFSNYADNALQITDENSIRPLDVFSGLATREYIMVTF